MKIPTNLRQKPVIVCDNYEKVDGNNANNTDAKALSLGLAQLSARGNVEVTAKVWKHTGVKWSSMGEELPLHRVLDLAILICSSYNYIKEEAYKYPEFYNKENPSVERIGLQGDAMDLKVCEDNEFITPDLKLVSDILGKDGELLGERFRLLSDELKKNGY